MSGSDYKVFLQADGISAAFTIANKTASGFDIEFTAGISGDISYIAAK